MIVLPIGLGGEVMTTCAHWPWQVEDMSGLAGSLHPAHSTPEQPIGRLRRSNCRLFNVQSCRRLGNIRQPTATRFCH